MTREGESMTNHKPRQIALPPCPLNLTPCFHRVVIVGNSVNGAPVPDHAYCRKCGKQWAPPEAK